jgi:hypothetical protein
VSLHALSCVVHEFLRSIAALFRGTLRYFDAILYCAGDAAGCTRGLLR